MLIHSAPRQSQALRTGAKQLRAPSDQEVNAVKKLCGTALACEADAPQALATFAQELQATFLATSSVCPTSRYGKRGRPSPGSQPASVVDHINGAFASRLTMRHALVDQQSCFILATHELDTTWLPPPELLQGYTGQRHAERGFRFLKDPQFLASSLYLKKPERIMALLMVMTVCLLVYAAREYRLRKALTDHGGTFPDQKGQPTQNPPARWVFHSFVGIHVLLIPQPWPIVINLAEEHRNLLQRLGARYAWFYR